MHLNKDVLHSFNNELEKTALMGKIISWAARKAAPILSRASKSVGGYAQRRGWSDVSRFKGPIPKGLEGMLKQKKPSFAKRFGKSVVYGAGTAGVVGGGAMVYGGMTQNKPEPPSTWDY